MKSLIYQFRRAKLASLLNLIGIALTLAGAYVLLTQVTYNRQYNHAIPDCADVYRVENKGNFEKNKWSAHLSRPLLDRIAQLPIAENFATVWFDTDWNFIKGDTKIANPFTWFSEKYTSILGLECVDGRLDLRPEDGFNPVIPASLAMKYFGL